MDKVKYYYYYYLFQWCKLLSLLQDFDFLYLDAEQY